jgi:hydroxymethylbilane synthase
VDTRLRKLDEGQYDSIVLAAAGLTRLGWSSRIAEFLEPDVMCPAVGQGALAIETRVGENACRALEHAPTRAAVTAERALLSALGGGCLTPIGAHARVEGEQLHLMAIVLSADGARSVGDRAEGPVTEAQRIGRELGEKLLEQGAARLLDRSEPRA